MTQHVGPYRLQQSLAKGGGGEVYRALGPGGHIVALKVLRGPFNERRRRRAEVELRAQRRLEHPAILPVLDCGWHGQIAYLVFPLVEGGSLQDRLKREGTLPTATALEVVRQLADGLAHAHAQGVLHRDLKPDNVLLTEAGARLIDFGLAQELEASYSRLTTSGTYLGTPGFWAPEQAQGELERIGPWTDVYGLGATLYACLSSRAPYVADTVGVMLSMLVQRAPPDPLGLLRPDLDPRVVGLCMRCLAFDPEQRPSLPALIQELDALLQGREQGAPRPRRGLGWFAGAAAGCAVLALGAAGYVVATQEAEPAPASPPAAGPRIERPEPEGDPAIVSPEADAPSDVSRGDRAIALCALSAAVLEGSLDLSQAYAEAAVRVAPEWGHGYFRRGNVHFFQGRLELAADDYRRALVLGIERPQEGLLNLGTCQRRLGLRELAWASYERALELAPDWAELRRVVAGVCLTEGDLDAAIAHYSRAIELDPRLTLCFANRAAAYLEQGRAAEAVRDLERAVRLRPSFSLGWENLSVARLRGGDLEGALGAIDRALALAPNAGRHLRRANVFERGERYEECLAEVELALAGDPGYVLAWVNKGDVLLSLGRAAEAERAFARLNELAPEDVRGYAGLGRARAARGDERGAIAAYDRALELDPEGVVVWQNRGSANARLGNYPEALASYSRALELDPSAWNARLNRGRVHKLMGTTGLARKDFQEVVDSGPAQLAAQARDLLASLP